MATDIAFAMGVYNFFKNRMPPAVATFLLTLATVDDLGAIAVIAVCFAKGIVPMYLGVSRRALRRHGARGKKKASPTWSSTPPWASRCGSPSSRAASIADIAGVISALAIPAGASAPEGTHAHKMDVDSEKVTLLDHLIHVMHPISSLLIMPLFALANCAVPVNSSALGGVMTTPVGLGIMAGA